MRQILLFLIFLLLCQCSSMERSVGLGIGIGAATGLTTSQLANYNTKGTVVLTAGGAIIGGLAAALLHKDPLAEAQQSQMPPNYFIKDRPPLQNAETDAIMVPDKIEGDRFEERHRVFIIKKPSHWQHYPATPDGKQQSKSEEEEDGRVDEKE